VWRLALKVDGQNEGHFVYVNLLYQTTCLRKSEDHNLYNRKHNTIYNCIIFSPLFYDTQFVYCVQVISKLKFM